MTGVRERALELLERRIADGRENGTAPDVTARECLVALEGLGYRPTEAKVWPAWTHGHPGSGKPPAGLLEELRADLAAKLDQAKAARETEDETGSAA